MYVCLDDERMGGWMYAWTHGNMHALCVHMNACMVAWKYVCMHGRVYVCMN